MEQSNCFLLRLPQIQELSELRMCSVLEMNVTDCDPLSENSAHLETGAHTDSWLSFRQSPPGRVGASEPNYPLSVSVCVSVDAEPQIEPWQPPTVRKQPENTADSWMQNKKGVLL